MKRPCDRVDKYNLIDFPALQPAGSSAYHELLRVPALSAGVYQLDIAAVDPQLPHHEDEIYYILSGAGKIAVGGEVETVEEGAFVYVPAGVPHHFFGITAPLKILVVFAPAESSDE